MEKSGLMPVECVMAGCDSVIWRAYRAPAVVLRFGRFLRAPLAVLLRCARDTLRSSVFLAFFVSGYLACVTGWQNVVRRGATPHRSVYWLSGLVASLSVVIEQKSKRSELALYVMPRAADSAFTTTSKTNTRLSATTSGCCS